MTIKYMPGVSPGILLRDNWRKNARSWNISILLQAKVASRGSLPAPHLNKGTFRRVPWFLRFSKDWNWTGKPLRSWNSNLNRTKLITGKWQRQNTSSAGISLAFFQVIEDTQCETLATGNPNVVLANKIISCYLLFSVFLYEPFWKEFESTQRRLALPVSIQDVSAILAG